MKHLRNLAGRAVKRLKQDTAAVRILTEWLGEGGNPVARDVAEKRAATCLRCPLNQPTRHKLEASVARAILEQEAARKSADLTLPQEGRLGTCTDCGCFLKLKVWVPLRHLGHKKMPPNCWMSAERMSEARNNPADAILTHYRDVRPIQEGRPKAVFGPNYTLTNVAQGLGDALILSDVWNASGRKVRPYTNSNHFTQVMSHVPGWDGRTTISPLLLDYPTANVTYDLGNGHNIQRIRRLFGLEVEMMPRPGIRIPPEVKPRDRVVIHLDPGVHVQWQQRNIHPRARLVYPENVDVISRWAASSGMDCFTVGKVGVPGVRHVHTETTMDLFREIAGSTWFLGIMSGPMHAAVGFGLRCVVIINFPDARSIFLPTLVSTGQVEEEWFYPQNVHLHQDNDGPLVPKFSMDTLKAAFAGDVYPFWNDRWLPLIHEKP